MRTSIKEIAEACGVSTQAVSYALNNSGRLSEETRTRIIEAARNMGYRRNPVADTMKSKRFGSVALLQSTNSNYGWIPSSLINELHRELSNHDLNLSLVHLDEECLFDEVTIPRLMQQWSYDGIFVTYDFELPYLKNLIEQRHLPAVWLNVQREQDTVLPDDEGDSYRAVRLLLEQGHRRIDYFSSEFAGGLHHSVMARRNGYLRAMQEVGLEPRILPVSGVQPFPEHLSDLRVPVKPVMDWLMQPERPTAILCYSESGILLAYSAALCLGLKIPQELSLMSFESAIFAVVLGMNQIWFPGKEVARNAVNMLIKKIDDPSFVSPPVRIPSGFHDGTSVAAPPLTKRRKPSSKR
jgi:LacI family transcriptional regulator